MKQFNSVLLIYNPNAMRGKIDEFVPHIKQRLVLRFPVVEVMSSPDAYGAEAIALKHAQSCYIRTPLPPNLHVLKCFLQGHLHNEFRDHKSQHSCHSNESSSFLIQFFFWIVSLKTAF